MPSEKHQAIASKLHELGASNHGFRRAVIEAVRLESGQESADLLDEDLKQDTKITPDAYRIDAKNRTVIAFEVEMFNAIDDAKMIRYVDWWWMLDDFEWTIRLVGVKCLANVGICYEIDMLAYVYATSNPKKCVLSVSSRNCADTIRLDDDLRDDSPSPSPEPFS